MMKMTVHRKHNVIKVFNKTRTLHSDAYWEDHVAHNALLLLEDHAHITTGYKTRERLLLLSTDSLILAKTKSLYLKLKARVSLSDIWLASCTHRVTNRKCSSKTSFVIGWPTINHVVTFSSSEKKDKWLNALQWHSVRARQRLIPNRLLLNVQLFDSLLTVAVSVDVHSTSESVIQSVIQQNTLTGGVSNYELCVQYDGEEEMYPLIGHELPYCILLYWLRGQRSPHVLSTHQWHSAYELRVTDDNNTTSPRFLLRTRTEIHTHTQTGSVKHKRKRSLIGWALRKGYVQSERQNDLETASNKLFGQSLASICDDGNVPKAIMDMLCVLYHEGPETLGIFRRSANAKICRILKDKLNLGHPVSLRGESVFVSASLLTEFLRNLPGSVLGCDLYEDWMSAMESEDQGSRCSSVKSVLAKLPQINRTLLCYVFGVFHRIHTHSDVNQMTASNLALCVSPNLLWRTTSSNPEEESQRLLQVAALVRFLIENAPSIFGDEAEDVFTTLMNAAQENNDLAADSSLPLHSSSEETDLDFFPSSLLSLDLEPFLPLSTLSLCPLTVATETTDSGSSCGTLDLSPAPPISLGDFGQSRDRCLSEPSMCFDPTSPSQAPPHPPVVRQSSCDNAVNGQSRSPVMQGRGRLAGKGRYAFWKSPQLPARFRHPAQRLASMSSLSSTTTSSLSSLDSFEYIPSPNDDKPRPFLFGTSARLRPLTPEMPRKLWTMAFTYDELKDGEKNGEKEKEKEEGVSKINMEDEQDGGMKEEKGGEMDEKQDGGMQPDEHDTPCVDEGISPHVLLHNEGRNLKTTHTHSHTQPCPTHTHSHTQPCPTHTHSLTLPSKPDKTSRLKITLFPSVGRRKFRQAGSVTMETGGGSVTMETGGGSVTMLQPNVPQTLFYNQNVNPESHGSRCKISDAGEECSRVSEATEDDANHELSINITDSLQHGADVSQTLSDIRGRKSCNQSVRQSDNRISINTSASIGNKININLNDSIRCDASCSDSAPANADYTVSISSINYNVNQSASASTSHMVSIADVNNASQSINTPGTSISRAISVNKIRHSVSISSSNANQNADASSKSSIRQIRIRIPATVRKSVRAYFSTHTHTLTHTHSAVHTQTHTLPKSQTRPLCTSEQQ